MFSSVLVANRGEIAVRVIRTLHALGVRAVAIYSDADAGARHVRDADLAIRIGPAPAADSYLNIDRVLDAARQAGVDAIHPGYGFLSENAAFARACAAAGFVFIGPPPDAIEAMGDKIRAKETVAAAGVPVVPGAGRPGLSDQDLIDSLNGAGFPLLVKPSAGGGGKGMRVVRSAAELPAALAAARREARAAFGDDTLLVERYLERPRHIEIQVLADGHGNVIHLGERECSLQRRHQKIIEEAPSPLLGDLMRAAMGAAAVEAARSVGYTGAGTVEFIVSGAASISSGGDDPSEPPRYEQPVEYFFLEMNTRLQVEHPVTEFVTGLDLVELQLRVAAGEALPVRQEQVLLAGHAVEARVSAEDPARGFLPTGGTVLALREPDLPDVRVDSGLAAGVPVATAYDPMLAKVIAYGPDRATALRRLDAALADMTVLGVTTNITFLRTLLHDPDVAAGRLDTALAERIAAELPAAAVPDDVLAAAALAEMLERETRNEQRMQNPWDIRDGWRVGEHAWTTLRLAVAHDEPVPVRVRGLSSAAQVAVGESAAAAGRAQWDSGTSTDAAPGTLVVSWDGRTQRYACARTRIEPGRTVVWLGRDGQSWAVAEEEPLAEARDDRAAGDGVVRSPMPGTVRAVQAVAGEKVSAGQPLLIVEAMKMEHTLNAPVDGVLTELTVEPGQQVGLDERLAVVTAEEIG
jgi:acetyl-CoA/propionyl-CoA carboxylase, biotin carboxylase, biotin carboxyl carrier protein